MNILRRVIYLAMAVILSCSLVYTAFAAVDFQPEQPTLVNVQEEYAVLPGEGFALQVNAGLLENESPTWGEDSEDLAFDIYATSDFGGKVSVFIDGEKSASQLWFSPNTSKAESYLTVAANPRSVSDSPYAVYTGAVSIVAYSRSSGEYAGSSNFSLQIVPVEGSLRSFVSGVAEVEASVLPTEPIYIPLEDDWFTYFGDSPEYNVINEDKILAYQLRAGLVSSQQGADFQVSIVKLEGQPVIRLEPLEELAVGADYNPVIRLEGGAHSLEGLSKEISLRLQVIESAEEATQLVRASTASPEATAAGNQIVGIAENAWLGTHVVYNGVLQEQDALESLRILPGDELDFPIDTSFFRWENGTPAVSTPLTDSMLEEADIAVRVSGSQATKFVETADIFTGSGGSYVRVKFVDYFISTGEREFDLTVSLSCNGVRHVGSQLLLSGTMVNQSRDMFNSDTYVDLSDGSMAYAVDSIGNIDIYLGDGVTLNTRMVRDNYYYGFASSNDFTPEDTELWEQHPEIHKIYHLKSINLNGAMSRVHLDVDPNYHVYDNSGEYLGTAGEELPYSVRYIVTTEPIDLFGVPYVEEPEDYFLEIHDEEVPLAAFPMDIVSGDSLFGNNPFKSANNGKIFTLLGAVFAAGCMFCAVMLIRQPED